MAEANAERHYYVTEGLFGEQPIWRVVRGETNARGMEVLSFVYGCATRRAALAMAGAMSAYRECQDAPVAVRIRGWRRARDRRRTARQGHRYQADMLKRRRKRRTIPCR